MFFFVRKSKYQEAKTEIAKLKGELKRLREQLDASRSKEEELLEENDSLRQENEKNLLYAEVIRGKLRSANRRNQNKRSSVDKTSEISD
ncbi:hypothetical protein [uncultured Parasutterella sp.]|uniref:hypothetical protein n=1 Tax=uncultured Parasutterella sp. TaxID=1263098 RepID=UPI00259931EE|nr:hypothetical protein [uncultured Parasutterella sp.]